ncbi:MAG: helix-turn-helix domain-containing protein [Patescibacteria group bacterium]|jgi:sugar-specific transcriptional regulator TrmB
MTIENLLKQFGFTVKETRVYLTSLGLGTASVQRIAQKAGVKRTTVYAILENLLERGIIGKAKVGKKTHYLAEPPEKLFSIVSNLRDNMKTALPQFNALYSKGETKPKITFFEGKEAIQNVYDDTLREKPTEIFEWNTNAYFQQFPKDHDYLAKRVALNIHAKRLAGSGSVWQTVHKRRDAEQLSETLIVPKEYFWPEIEVNIYNNKVAFMNYAEQMSVIIESQAIADAMRQVYDLSWRGAKTLQDK